MNTPDKTIRTEFWKFAYARSSFVDTRIFAEYLLAAGVDMRYPLRRAYSFAITTTYARPFKQRQPVRLSEDLVPAAHKMTHDGIIEIRDKIVAHRDINGPIAEDFGLLNQVQIVLSSGELQVNTISPIMGDDKVREVVPLAAEMEKKMDYHLHKYLNKLKPHIGWHDGRYALSLEDNPEQWLIREKE